MSNDTMQKIIDDRNEGIISDEEAIRRFKPFGGGGEARRQTGETHPLVLREYGETWVGRWHGHLVRISDECVKQIRENRDSSAMLVGPDGQAGLWIACTTPDGWTNVPTVRVWYPYEDFVEYVKLDWPQPERKK